MEQGFFTALGTSFDSEGHFCEASFSKQIEDQMESGASGLLAMGSMGQQPYITNGEYTKVASCAAKAAKGKCPVLVGVMDTSIARVLDRVKAVEKLSIDGVVVTAPYYYTATQAQLLTFYQGIADASPYPVYLYDLPPVAGISIASNTIRGLWNHSNIRGIKSGNLVTMRTLMRDPAKPKDFDLIFSNLDEFDIAYSYGIKKNLDGMLSCTPKTTSKLFTSMKNADFAKAGDYLDQIISLRDLFVGAGSVFGAFTYAMNLLGYKGNFSPDYMGVLTDEHQAPIRECLERMGEL